MGGQTQDVTKKEITLRMPCELYEALQGMSAEVGIPVSHLVLIAVWAFKMRTTSTSFQPIQN